MSEKLKLRPSGNGDVGSGARFYETKPDCSVARERRKRRNDSGLPASWNPATISSSSSYPSLFLPLPSPRCSRSESSLYLSREIYTRVYAPVNAAVTRDLVSAFATLRCLLVLRIKLFSSSSYIYIYTYICYMCIHIYAHNTHVWRGITRPILMPSNSDVAQFSEKRSQTCSVYDLTHAIWRKIHFLTRDIMCC